MGTQWNVIVFDPSKVKKHVKRRVKREAMWAFVQLI